MVHPFAVIGGEPQDVSYRGTSTRVEIGDRNVIREAVTIHRGSEKEEGVTRIGSNNLLMVNVHVAHDCHGRRPGHHRQQHDPGRTLPRRVVCHDLRGRRACTRS